MLSRLKFDIDSLVNEILDQLPEEVFKSSETTFCDPAMGGGQFVKEVEERLRRYGHDNVNISKRVYGYEANPMRINYAVDRWGLVGTYEAKNFLEEDINMKFDVICGNPPFQKQNTTNSTRTAKLYVDFFEKSTKLSDNVLFITSSNWINDPNSKMHKISKDTFDKIKECSNHFDISIPTCYFIWKKSGKKFSFNKYPKNNLGQIWYRTNINRNDKRIGINGISFIEITGNKNQKLKYKKIDICPNNIKNYNLWKVIFNNVGGYKNIGAIKIAPPKTVTSFSVVSLLVQTKQEANNLKHYLESKYVIYLISQIKQQTPNSKKVFSFIPLPDLSKSWTDEELYKHFKLTKEEIDLIESTVK